MLKVDSVRIQPLFEYLDGLTGRADEKKLGAVLQDLDITVDDLAEFVHFEDSQYVRNLIRGSEHYHALLICWRSGQRSPIHNHADSACGVRVLKGTGTETLFAPTPCGQVKALASRDMHVGYVGTIHDAGIHQMSNLQAAGRDLITLHIYSPPLLRMDTYSLTDTVIGEFRPTILEHSLGSGI